MRERHPKDSEKIPLSPWRLNFAPTYEQKGPTNAEFAKNNPAFISACMAADIEATERQASKFRSKRGLAYKVHRRRNR